MSAATAVNAADLSALPIIDLSKLDNPETREEFYKELRHLAKDIGFFYLVGHGIDPKLRQDLLETSKKFFALPLEEKEKINISNLPNFRGYTAVSHEKTRGKSDYREQIDFGQDVPAIPEAEIGKQLWLRMIGPNQYPEQVPELKPLVLEYMAAARAVVIKLLKAFLVALELPENSLDELIGGTPQNTLKLVRYPGLDSQPEAEEDLIAGDNNGGEAHQRWQGVGPHKDPGLLTFLHQDSTGGLQVETAKGWIDIPPVENAYVINIGETLEMATDGYLFGNVHQVVMKDHKADRYSMPFFLGNNLRAGKIPQLELPPHLKAQAQGPSRDPTNPLFFDVGFNALKPRLRSHLDVTERFYPEKYEEVIRTGNISKD